jgi:ribosome assembly protein 1
VRLRVRPLPAEVTAFLNKNATAIKRLYSDRKAEEEGKKWNADNRVDEKTEDEEVDDDGNINATRVLSPEDFKRQLQQAFEGVKGERDIWTGAVERITCFGPRRTGPNVLIDATKTGICGKL